VTDPEQVERDLNCARCRRPVRLSWKPVPAGHQRRWRGTVVVAMRNWPEGYICSGCFAQACETYGCCAGCKTDRLLPGIGTTGDRLCTDCAGGLGDYTCTRCGEEGWLQLAGVCARCVLAERLAAILDNGRGEVRPELAPFVERICRMSRPRSGLLWLSKPHVPPILHVLARGTVPLTHDGLSTLTPWRSVIYVRDLLVECGVLPPVDRFLLLFQQWLPTWLATIDDLEHRKILHRFAVWHVLRHLRAVAAEGPIGPYRNTIAWDQLKQAAGFLAELDGHGRGLIECTQADIDLWFAAQIKAHLHVRSFLSWAIRRRYTNTALTLPPSALTAAGGTAPISQKERLALIRRVHTDQQMELVDRVVALLILLYAQPLSRIVRLTVDDVLNDDSQVYLRLGDPPAPVPEPFASVFTDYVAARSNLATATNRDSTLLFPGRRAGQPIHPASLRLRLQTLGIPNLDGRSRAIREMLLQAPASVIAGMLGYHAGHAEVIAVQAGATWKRYAASRAP
jgi:hypothetical protein